MNSLNLDKYLDIVNEEKIKRGLEDYAPLYPMLRVVDNKLYVGVILTHSKDDVWNKNEHLKGEYWVLIDILTNQIIEFNKTSEKDFVKGSLIPKNTLEKEQELSKYTVEKTLQYKNYLIEDILKEKLPFQKKLATILGDEMVVLNEKVNINEYLLANLEEDINNKINELVNILVNSKYGSITFYYDKLVEEVINEYQKNNIINESKIKLCIEIMNYYYDGVIGIDNFFNLKS